MASSYTTNKRIEKPANGDDIDTWDVPVNADWDIIDASFGGVTTLNVAGISGTVTLTAAQYRPPMIAITGAQTANINYQLPSGVGGFWSVYNGTSGAYTITISSAGGGSTVGIAQGHRINILSDGTNILNWGSDYASPITSTTFTAKQTFSGTSTNLAEVLTNAAEVVTVSASSASGTIAMYAASQSILYFTNSSGGNWTMNLTHSAGTTFNTTMSAGQCVTMTFASTQGVTGYYNNVVQIDGSTSGVTTVWQGSAPVVGGSNGVDIYSYAIIKTGSGTFTVFASFAQFR